MVIYLEVLFSTTLRPRLTLFVRRFLWRGRKYLISTGRFNYSYLSQLVDTKTVRSPEPIDRPQSNEVRIGLDR